MKKFAKTSLAIAATLVLFGQAHADYVITDFANVQITGNSDNIGATEGVFIRSNGNAAAYSYMGTDGIATFGGTYTNLNGLASTTINGPITTINAGTATINAAISNIGLEGNAVNIGRALSTNSIAGSTNITGALTQVGATSITGATSILGATSITGVTSINTVGGQSTTLGTLGGASVNTLQGSANNLIAGSNNITADAANTIFGATNSLTASTGGNAISAATGNAITAGTSNVISAAASNNISAAANNISGSVVNSIQGPMNKIGTDDQSTNIIGNVNSKTKVHSVAGNAAQFLENGIANTTVTTTAATASVLAGATVAPSSQVLLSNVGGTTVDANGMIVTGGAEGPTAAVTVTNGLGNTHGLVVTESQTTLSGGTQSSSMTLTDRAATFSNAQTGAPITVTGVANGRADFDAVNVRQFAGAIAAVSAQTNIPALAAGQDRNFGIGMGHFMGKSALAMGMSIRGTGNSIYKATLSSGLSAGTSQAVVGVGAAWGF